MPILNIKRKIESQKLKVEKSVFRWQFYKKNMYNYKMLTTNG